MIDLDAYFARIGYSGPTAPTLATLAGIVERHVEAIPFENLNVLLGLGIDLSPAAIERKLVTDRRGGYCFEQNGFLLLVLEHLGFDVTPLSARVRVGRPRDFTPPRTHLFVRLELEGHPWLADVGVGGLSLTAPIRFELDVEQGTPHEPRRIVHEAGRYFHQARLADEWVDVCEFTGEAMPPIDRELANWYTSAHPQSHFRSRLMAARSLPAGGRLTLLNRELTVRGRDGMGQKRQVASPDELVAVLDREFGLQFPPGTVFPCEGLDWGVQAGT